MLSYFFSLKTRSRKKIPHPQIKIQSLSVSSFFLSYIALLNQDRARYTIVFLICLFRIYMRKPGIVVFRKLQSNALVRLQTIKKSLVQEGGMFGVLRKHCSEACGRRLYLVLLYLKKNKMLEFYMISSFKLCCSFLFLGPFLNTLRKFILYIVY